MPGDFPPSTLRYDQQLSLIATDSITYMYCYNRILPPDQEDMYEQRRDYRYSWFQLTFPTSFLGDALTGAGGHATDLAGMSSRVHLWDMGARRGGLTIRHTTLVNLAAAGPLVLAPSTVATLYGTAPPPPSPPPSPSDAIGVVNPYRASLMPKDERELAHAVSVVQSPAPLANYTSCLWFVAFNRTDASAAYAAGHSGSLHPRLWLENVVLHVPLAEVEAMKQLWRASQAVMVAAAADSAGPSHGDVGAGGVADWSWLAPLPDDTRALLVHHLQTSQVRVHATAHVHGHKLT